MMGSLVASEALSVLLLFSSTAPSVVKIDSVVELGVAAVAVVAAVVLNSVDASST